MGKRKLRDEPVMQRKVKRTPWNKRRKPLNRQQPEVSADREDVSGDETDTSERDILQSDTEDNDAVPAHRLLAATFHSHPAAHGEGGKTSADGQTSSKSPTSLLAAAAAATVSNIGASSIAAITRDKDDVEADPVEEIRELNSTDDPFVCHFERVLSEEEADSARKKEHLSPAANVTFPSLGMFTVKSPPDAVAPVNAVETASLRHLEKSHVRLSLVKNLTALHGQTWTAASAEAFTMLNSYRDLFHFDKDHRLDVDFKRAYCLHVLNHVLKARSRVVDHNEKLKPPSSRDASDFKDQGFARPKVLIIVPFKHNVFRIYETLAQLLTSKDDIQVMNKARFEKEFGWDEKDPVTSSDRPEDFRATFTANTDDCFRVGISITKKTLKMYTEFYSADIIIASPLGLRMIIGTEGEKQHEYDFLSSIEMLIMDQADVFMMQNWEHISLCMKFMHRQPKTVGKVDFARVRLWVLNGWGQLYRQTIFLSAFRCPEFQALATRSCLNFAGGFWHNNASASATEHSLAAVVVPMPHCFHRIPGGDCHAIADARFSYFTEKILPQLSDSSKAQTIIFIPSYFDFVRIRNHLRKEDVSSVQICEYSSTAKVARARDLFYHGKKHFLLYTERFHFYRRYRIKGIRHILFYELPHYPHFYSELCNMMGGEEMAFHQFTSDVLYSKFDAFKLSAVVGAARLPAMLQPDKAVHMFVTC